jgi:DNA-binding response OmpR family regulator
VEDEPLIALDIVEALKPTGAHIITAGLLQQALRISADVPLAAAVLDFKIGDGDSKIICDLLRQRGIPFLVYSGYDLPGGVWADVTVLQKPATPHKLITAVRRLLQNVAAPTPKAA